MLSLKIVCGGGMPSMQASFEAHSHSLYKGVIIQLFPRLIIKSFIWSGVGNWYGS